MLLLDLLRVQITKQLQNAAWLAGMFGDSIIGTVLERHRDVILITGGCSGLGKAFVREFKRRGCPKIVVFDLRLPQEQDRILDVHYYECDVSDKDRIMDLKHVIEQEIGIVTIILNNAGITSGKSLMELSFKEIEKIINVNLMSSFYINKVFLPDMIELQRGYVVTVASVLGYMAPANLTAYGAAKSGLIAFHESLTYELGPPLGNKTGIKTLLVCPGQLKTDLFQGVNTPSSILAPKLEPSYVAQKVVRAIECGQRGELKLPIYGHFLPLFRSLPWPSTQFARMLSGMDESMHSYNEEKSK